MFWDISRYLLITWQTIIIFCLGPGFVCFIQNNVSLSPADDHTHHQVITCCVPLVKSIMWLFLISLINNSPVIYYNSEFSKLFFFFYPNVSSLEILHTQMSQKASLCLSYFHMCTDLPLEGAEDRQRLMPGHNHIKQREQRTTSALLMESHFTS